MIQRRRSRIRAFARDLALGLCAAHVAALALMLGAGSRAHGQTLAPDDPALEVLDALADTARQERIDTLSPGISIAPQIVPLVADEDCVVVNNIRVEGTSTDPSRDVWLVRKRPRFDARGVLVSEGLLEVGTVQDLVARFGATCMGVSAINRLIGELTNTYVVQGYITSRVFIPDQDLTTGELVLVAVEGVIEALPVSVEVAPDPKTGQVSPERLERALRAGESQVRAALATDVGDYLNLRLLEQSIDNLNAVPSTTASLQLVPGQAVGGSLVPIALAYDKPWRASLGASDSGSASTGELTLTASFEYDNLLNLNDQLRVNYSGALDTNSLVFNAKLPTGLHAWELTATYSEFRNILGATSELFNQSGSITLRDDRLIARDALDKHWVYGALSWDGAQRNINGTALTFVNNVVGTLGYRNELQVPADRFAWLDRQGNLLVDVFVDLDLGKEPGSTAPQEPSPRLVAQQTWNQALAPTLSWTSDVSVQLATQPLRAARQMSLPGVARSPGAVDYGITLDQTLNATEPFAWLGRDELGSLTLSYSLRGGWGVAIADGEERWTLGSDFSATWTHDNWNRELGYTLPLRSSNGEPGEPEIRASITRNF